MTPSLRRASGRHLLRHPWQMGLSVLGIALGVAVVLSIDLANESARRSFGLFARSVAGRATHEVSGGPSGLPDEVYRRIRLEAGLREAAPVVERTVAAPEHPGVTFHLLGIDPFAEGPVRSFTAAAPGPAGDGLAALVARPATALVARDTLRRLGLAPGDGLVLRVGTLRRRVTLVGELVPGDELSARAMESLLVTDIATAQELLAAPGRLSRIDLVVPAGAAGAAVLARVRAVLPPGASVVRAGARADAVEQMTRALQLNLQALSLLALVVGLFLIYNTMTFSVVQRRELFGVLRVLGVTRGEVLALVLGEALALGALGAALGLPLGVLLAQGLVRLVTTTINDLYVTLTVTALAVPPATVLKAAALGLVGTVVAAVAPAVEATATVPRAVLSRSVLEARSRRAAPRLALAGAAAALGGWALLAAGPATLAAAYAGLFAVLLGAALLTPVSTMSLMRVLRPVMGRLFGMLGRMAAGSVVQASSRTSVAMAALMVALAATIGVGVMIGSFRQTVVRWLEMSLAADVYVSAPSLVSSRPDATLAPDLVARLRAVPGVARVDTLRTVRVDAPGGAVLLLALAGDRAWERFDLAAGDPASVPGAVEREGAVIVSEPLAWRRGLSPGARLRLATDRGERDFPVAGIYRDYGSTEGVVLVSRATFDRFWDDRALSSLGLHAAPGVAVEPLVDALRRAAGPGDDVVIRSNRALREASLVVFDRTFAVTIVLRALATLVAFVGVLSALMALLLERGRELAVLRAQGLTAAETWGLVTAQTGLMGLVAGLLAIPVGIALAVVLVFVVNQRSFGWTLTLEVGPGVLVQAVAVAIGAALLAGLYPARRMARLPLPEALRGE